MCLQLWVLVHVDYKASFAIPFDVLSKNLGWRWQRIADGLHQSAGKGPPRVDRVDFHWTPTPVRSVRKRREISGIICYVQACSFVAVLHIPEVNGCIRTLKVEFLLMLQDARAPEAVHHVLCLRLQDLVQQRRSCHGAVPP